MAKICIVDDDPNMTMLVDGFENRGHAAMHVRSASEALEKIEGVVACDAVILDVLMPINAEISFGDTPDLEPHGMKVFREIRKRNRNLPIVAISASQDLNVIEVLIDDPSTKFISKWDSHPIRQIIAEIYAMLRLESPRDAIQSFIVHGHADQLKLELKNYIQNTLKWAEPIILHEQASLGRTIIEKLERYAEASSMVFVLLTPDDVAASAASPNDTKRRARQNVIFELGYFLGVLGRESGRVILLYKGELELPGDLSGVVYIDVSKGIAAAGEEIRKEVAHVAGR